MTLRQNSKPKRRKYIPDPMGRLGQGTWVGEDERPDLFSDSFSGRNDRWKSGFGDGPLKQISRTVGINGANRPDDVARIEAMLDRTGHLDLSKTDGPTGYFGHRLDQAIRDFQKDRGPKRDGILNPDGETISVLRRDSGITKISVSPQTAPTTTLFPANPPPDHDCRPAPQVRGLRREL